MPVVERSAVLPYPAAELFELVDRVEAYPSFLPWCRNATVHARDESHTLATLSIDVKGFKHAFTTHNAKFGHQRIEMRLQEGPFRHLNGHWHFVALAADACRVEFRLDYEFANVALRLLAGPAFSILASGILDAFVRRARELHGR